MCRCRKMNKIRVKTTEIVDLYFKSKAFNYFRQENCPKSHMWATNLIRLTLKYLSILPCCTCSKGWLFGIMIFLRNSLVLNRAGSGVLISQSSATIWLLALACEQFYERRSKRGKGSGFARAPSQTRDLLTGNYLFKSLYHPFWDLHEWRNSFF